MGSVEFVEAIRYKEACQKAAEISFLSVGCKAELFTAIDEIDRRIEKAVDEGGGVMLNG